jgi:hypothetical protein
MKFEGKGTYATTALQQKRFSFLVGRVNVRLHGSNHLLRERERKKRDILLNNISGFNLCLTGNTMQRNG